MNPRQVLGWGSCAGRKARITSERGTHLAKRRATAVSLRKAAGADPTDPSVHLGSGPVHLDGWLNVDIDRSSSADAIVDLRHGLPLPASSARFVYSEHVFEHLDLTAGRELLGEILATGGVIRVAMPDLATLVDKYRSSWRDKEWLEEPGFAHVDTAANMLNFALRPWGHLYVYDFDDLALRLGQAGHSKVERVSFGESCHEALRHLERRPDSLLIVEATP